MPGGDVRLGHDADRFVPDARQVADFAEAAGEHDLDVLLIQAPNLFGLVIGQDPYQAEFTTDPTVLCGGDGGAALCGGYGSFLSWLTLATAYREPDLAQAVHDGSLTGETPVRPTLHLP
ncbi:hypothetical protein ACIBTV_05080 [Micromonospora sp. NPDC049366]|uniref:hypothetical protein n=1 Tax=Micromonospora sp. NPDC049366 TaxID=3364271 RepID=UPI0037A6EE3D